MALRVPAKRLASSGHCLHQYPLPLRLVSQPQTRSLFDWLRSRRTNSKSNPLDPTSPDVLKRRPTPPSAFVPASGDLAPSSIFEQEDLSASNSTDQKSPAARATKIRRRDPNLTAAVLDPNPLARRRWERKVLIRSIHHRFRIRKSVLLARTERQSLTKSHFFKTSIKKLGPLARQIAGKKVEDAIMQMRFSRKKIAGEVLKHLEYARNEAIVRRGMGLGKIGEKADKDGVQGNVDGVVVEKSGKKRIVRDKTEMYVDQAWVGRGSYGRLPDYRARGQTYIMRPPTTSITVLLKEEATRIRMSQEKEEKRKAKKPWVPLLDRPVTAQRQYCMW